MASLIELCNRSLAAVAKGQIASLNEQSIEAGECVRFAQPLLDEMIGWSDNMPLGRRRVVLAEVTNDRPSEWLFAYAKPSDMETPLALRRREDPAQCLPEGGPFNFPLQDGFPLRFLLEGDKLYSNVATATLIYTAASIQASELSGLMQKAFVDELAVRIATPLTKDPKVGAALANVAELSRARAVAHEENKMPQRQTAYVSDAELARMGIMR
ncbi:hypothetical protein [Novosphingobium sp. ST904]|uniref:hypothetical protein n=1 Tax=Novosphingobium sp. ST904 TaxID=1684385 RepID=UPI0006C899F8|nr:hypothetical protein [Novosphingobium sp. ST904]KPH66954.1 hypothetical protein ADT71_03540 [Novosphingobium sp. ST904]TCM25704.1 hypothetical protein EDF59_13916 [Novosphingobium sp. ST904]